MLVTSQLPIQTTKIFYSYLTCTCAPAHWKRFHNPCIWLVGWLHALMQSDCLYFLFFEHYNSNLLCNWVLGRYSVCLRAWAFHNVLLYLALTRVGLSVLLSM